MPPIPKTLPMPKKTFDFNFDSTANLQCPICQEYFEVQSQLLTHINSCVKTLKSLKKKHAKDESGKYILECDYCDEKFKWHDTWRSHMSLRHTGERPYKCELCPKTFVNRSGLTIHTRRHAKKQVYQCKFCDITYSTKNNLTRHLTTHAPGEPFNCFYCGDVFQLKEDMITHKEKEHTGDKPYKCLKCYKCYKTRLQWRKHVNLHKIKNYNCTECKKSFLFPYLLQKHLAVHAEKTLHQCESCEKTFESEALLSEHRATHSMKYRCLYCAVGIGNTKSMLVKHMVQHQIQ